MRQSGRGNWIFLALVVIVLAIVAMSSFTGESASTATQRFMTRLAMMDAEGLADMSFFDPPQPRDEVVKAWKRSLEIGKYFRYIWRIEAESSPAPNRASVQVDLTRDADKGSAYSENFSVDLVKQNGKWLVDVRSLSREMYPALPR